MNSQPVSTIPQSELDRTLDDLEKTVHVVSDSVDMIKRKLEPVLHSEYPDAPSKDSACGEAQELTAVALRIKALTDKLESINHQITKTTQRLGI